MNSSNQDYDCKNGQFNFFFSDSNQKLPFLSTSDTTITSLSSMNDDHSSHQTLFGTYFNNQMLMEDENEQKTAQKVSNGDQKKKRNTQNSIRTILRKFKLFIKNIWQITDPKFFESQKQLNLLAIFRKANQCGLLHDLKTELSQKFAEVLNQQIVKQNKELKLQRYLKFFKELNSKDLTLQNIDQIIQKMSKVGQFKYHPNKHTVQHLLKIEAQIINLK